MSSDPTPGPSPKERGENTPLSFGEGPGVGSLDIIHTYSLYITLIPI